MSGPSSDRTPARRITRRRLLLGAALGVGSLATCRLCGYPALPRWRGQVLALWQAQVLIAAAQALLPPAPADEATWIDVARAIDAYLVGLPAATRAEVEQLTWLLEHGTTLFSPSWQRLTRLAPAEREVYLASLRDRGGLLSQAYWGARDLCMLGYYQQPHCWPALGYSGPTVGPRARVRMPRYARIAAAAGQLPRGVIE